MVWTKKPAIIIFFFFSQNTLSSHKVAPNSSSSFAQTERESESFEQTRTTFYAKQSVGHVTNCSIHLRRYGLQGRQFYFASVASSKANRAFSAVHFRFQQIQEINNQVAQFRDLLINVGQPRDCPELREKIRRLRRNCVEACRNTSQLILPQVRR